MLQILSFYNLDMPGYLAIENGHTNRPGFFSELFLLRWEEIPLPSPFWAWFWDTNFPQVTWGAERGGCQITKECTLKIYNQVVTLNVKAGEMHESKTHYCSTSLLETVWKIPTPTAEKIHIGGEENAKFSGKDRKHLKIDTEKLQVNT